MPNTSSERDVDSASRPQPCATRLPLKNRTRPTTRPTSAVSQPLPLHAGTGARMRVYVPYGGEWYAYLVIRLAERPQILRFFLRSLGRNS